MKHTYVHEQQVCKIDHSLRLYKMPLQNCDTPGIRISNILEFTEQ